MYRYMMVSSGRLQGLIRIWQDGNFTYKFYTYIFFWTQPEQDHTFHDIPVFSWFGALAG
jgi:hypothetical protein